MIPSLSNYPIIVCSFLLCFTTCIHLARFFCLKLRDRGDYKPLHLGMLSHIHSIGTDLALMSSLAWSAVMLPLEDF